MEKIIRERKKRRRRAIESSKRFIDKIVERFGYLTAIMVGSYARGDFNEWSDIDILIIVDRCDENPLRRYNDIIKVMAEMEEAIEPIIITKEEFKRGLEKRNPMIMEALRSGIRLRDDLKLLDRDNSA